MLVYLVAKLEVYITIRFRIMRIYAQRVPHVHGHKALRRQHHYS